MPNRRSRPYSYRPNKNPHNPGERFVRPNGKQYYARSPMKVVKYQDGADSLLIVFRTHDPDTARRLITITYPDVVLGPHRKDWVKEFSNPAQGYHEIEFGRGEDGAPAVVFVIMYDKDSAS